VALAEGREITHSARQELTDLAAQIEDMVQIRAQTIAVIHALKKDLADTESLYGHESDHWKPLTNDQSPPPPSPGRVPPTTHTGDPRSSHSGAASEGTTIASGPAGDDSLGLPDDPLVHLGLVSRVQTLLEEMPDVADVYVRRVEGDTAIVEVTMHRRHPSAGSGMT